MYVYLNGVKDNNVPAMQRKSEKFKNRKYPVRCTIYFVSPPPIYLGLYNIYM